MKYLIILCIFIIYGCTTPSKIIDKESSQEVSQVDNNISIDLSKTETIENIEKKFKDYFSDNSQNDFFKILITKDNYYIKQTRFEDFIQRIEDTEGDAEQLKIYNQLYEKINFIDYDICSLIKVKINPQNGNIESIDYHPNYFPKTKKAMKLFMDDIARYKFKIIKPDAFLNEVYISIRWIIEKNPDLSPEAAKRKAIEYIKSEQQEIK